MPSGSSDEFQAGHTPNPSTPSCKLVMAKKSEKTGDHGVRLKSPATMAGQGDILAIASGTAWKTAFLVAARPSDIGGGG